MQSVLAEIQTMLQERYHLSALQVGPDQELAPLGIDSLSAVEMLFELEERFDIMLSDERGEARTVSDVVAIVERALAAKGTAA